MLKRGKRRNEPGYGQGEHSIAIDDDVLLDEKALKMRLLEAFHRPGYQPPALPSTAFEIMELSRRSDISFDDVAQVIESDAMLAAAVVRRARSPVYDRSGCIESLRDALTRLGLRTLRDIVLEAAMNMRVFKCPAYAPAMERLRRHSAATGRLARLVARHAGVPDEFAFLCGLLHDVGMAGVLLALGDVPRGQKAPALEVAWPAIDGVHEAAGERIGSLWNLPAEILTAIKMHHAPESGGACDPAAATVCLAEQLANERGLGFAPDEAGEDADAQLSMHVELDRSAERVVAAARDALGLDAARWDEVAREADALCTGDTDDAD